MRTFENADDEVRAVAGWLMRTIENGVSPETIAILVRSEAEVPLRETGSDQ